MSHPTVPAHSPRPSCGSSLLDSCGARVARVTLAVAFMWVLTGWAMGWLVF